MEQFGLPYYYYIFCLFLALVVLRAKFGACKKPSPRLPPGPWQLPVIGSLHHMLRAGGLPHHAMRDLSMRHGQLMLLRICERVVVVVSSAKTAREIFKVHDSAFAQRPSSPGIDELSRHGMGILFAPYGEQWRQNMIIRHHEERRTAAGDGDGEQNMIDVLLRIQKEGAMRVALTPGIITAVLTDVFGAALDTSITTLHWAMAELIANPRVMEKAQLEIRRILAGHGRAKEASLINAHYLKAVVKETLRLHPPGPLIPRLCLDDRKIEGYDVPRGTIVVTNVWAISRDPKYWDNPDKFMPERFDAQDASEFRGSDFEFMPFGAGRRICPGMTFALANIEIALASLLYHFDWELPVGVKPEEIDMTEQFGITVKRKSELLLHPVPLIPPADA